MREVEEALSALPQRNFLDPFWREARLFPHLNVKKDGNSFVVTAEVPGIDIEDLEIRVEGDTLSLKGERKRPAALEGVSYHRRERAAGTFQRSLTLPNKVDADSVSATYKNGVLKVVLPLEKNATPKQISITTG